MSANSKNELPRVVQRNAIATRLCFFASALLLTILNASPASSQNMYTDSWFDDSSGGKVVGRGVTDGSYTHSYVVDAHLRSPNGRNAFASRRLTGYASAQVSLAFDINDLGDFVTDTEHWARCPGDDLNYYFAGSTSDRGRVGASKVVMRNTLVRDSQGRCIYKAIDPCNVICKGRGEANDNNCTSNFAVWIEPWINFGVGTVCLPWLEQVVYTDFHQPCGDT